jgi:hypothetical protein
MERRVFKNLHYALITAIILTNCKFKSEVKPLEIEGPSDPMPLSTLIPTHSIEGTPSPVEMTAEQAIALCKNVELWGDEFAGSCLAPGGETYLAWVGDHIIEVPRGSEHLQSFREAALIRTGAWEALENKVTALGGETQALFETMGKTTSCPVAGALMSTSLGPQGIVTIIGVSLLGGYCVYQAYKVVAKGSDMAENAESLVTDLNDFYQDNLDAGYEFCRLEGGSDADCRYILDAGE